MAFGNGGGGIGGFNVSNPATANIARNNIGAELERNHSLAETLLNAILELEKRLEPVLTPKPPSPAGGDTSPATPCSSIVQGLRAGGYRIDAATMRVQELLSRLEL